MWKTFFDQHDPAIRAVRLSSAGQTEDEAREEEEKEKSESMKRHNSFLPVLLGGSEILKPKHVADLEGHLPYAYRGYNWQRIFSVTGNGANLERFYDIGAKYKATILVVEDFEGTVFGGFVTEPWRMKGSNYFGTGETFFSHSKMGHANRSHGQGTTITL